MNQPPSDPPVAPPPDPPVAPPPADLVNGASIRKRALIIVPMLLVMLLAAVAIGMLAFSGNEPEPPTNNSSSQFPNQLTPTSEIKVGTHRYLSPCQVLPLSTAADIYGRTDAKTVVAEDSLSASVPANSSNDIQRLSCAYRLAGGKIISLRADQYIDAEELKRVRATFFVRADEIRVSLDKLKRTAGNNQDAKELVNTFEKSLQQYEKYVDERDPAALDQFNPDGMALPVDLVEGTMMIYKNTVYTLETGVAVTKASASDLAKINRTLKAIKANANNKKLDQSPAPTILGNSDRIGSTRILEPCVILSRGAFKTITGFDNNDTVQRITLPVDSNRDLTDKRVNKRIVFSNSCQRQYDGGDTDARAELELYHARSTARAEQFMKDYNDNPNSASRVLQTKADEATVFPDPVRPELTLYVFRVGPYTGVLNMATDQLTAAGRQTVAAPEARYIEAINLLSAEINRRR